MADSPRCGSPVTGCSTLMTSAPHSASTAPAAGTYVHDATSTTRTPSMTPAMRAQPLLFSAPRIASASHNRRVVALPVPVAQQALVELAGGQTRQLALEVNRPRALVVSDVLSAESDELALEMSAGLDPGHRLNDGLDLLAEVVVGDAEDGRV